MTLLKKIIDLANKPKKRAPRKALLVLLGVQGALLLFVLGVLTFFPGRAPALGALVFLSLGISAILFVEFFDSPVGTRFVVEKFEDERWQIMWSTDDIEKAKSLLTSKYRRIIDSNTNEVIGAVPSRAIGKVDGA